MLIGAPAAKIKYLWQLCVNAELNYFLYFVQYYDRPPLERNLFHDVVYVLPLSQMLIGAPAAKIKYLWQLCIHAELNYYLYDVRYFDRPPFDPMTYVLSPLQMLIGAPAADIERLWQLCINAEPNYGTLWFHCKNSVLLTTRQVRIG